MGLKDIRGQERAIEILRRSAQQKKMAHAYLFLGPSSTGKKKTAIELAKLLNCESEGSDACGSCPSCIKIEKSIHPDMILISKEEKASLISIERIREMQERLSLKPYEAKYKIVVISQAEDMSEEASNCLLKILEEPTPDTLLILTVSNLRRLPSTIISRCQIVRFKPLNTDDVRGILIKNFGIEEKEARFLSAISGADISKALTLKDKEALEWKNSVIDEFCKYGYQSYDDKSIILDKSRNIQIEAMDILMGFYRDLLIYKFVEDKELIINTDRMDDISNLAQETEAERIEKAVRDIEETKAAIAANANIKLALNVLKEKLVLK